MTDAEIVGALLHAHGLEPTERETAALVAGYTGARAAVAVLAAMPGVRYAEPALVFTAGDPRRPA